MTLRFKAIAAMALNRVIGLDNRIPWHLPEDFKWFKQRTTGHVLIMGRKTFESIGRPLPQRTTVVLSRRPLSFPGVKVVSGLEALDPADPDLAGKEWFICGGAEIYSQALPQCAELYLTLVQREVNGDTFFPPFEHLFDLAEILRQTPDFHILRYVRKLGPASA